MSIGILRQERVSADNTQIIYSWLPDRVSPRGEDSLFVDTGETQPSIAREGDWIVELLDGSLMVISHGDLYSVSLEQNPDMVPDRLEPLLAGLPVSVKTADEAIFSRKAGLL